MSDFTSESMIVLRRDTHTLHIFTSSEWIQVQVSVLLDMFKVKTPKC